jgi:thiol-disulfide isomerase/thioredoxin
MSNPGRQAMKKMGLVPCSISFFLLFFAILSYPYEKGQALNVQGQESVRKMVKDASELAERDQAQEAVAMLKKAISLAPNYLKAHAEYIRIKTYLMEKYDEVRGEYESLMIKEPNNPVYPMALAVGQYLTPDKNAWFEKVAELAPDWAWGHYAKAALIQNKEPEKAAAELLQCIEEDKTYPLPYFTLMFLLQNKLGKIDEAISLGEKMAEIPELHASALQALWQLRIAKAQGSEEFKASLKEELLDLAKSSRNREILLAAYRTFLHTLEDKESAGIVANKIRQVEPAWYPERGQYLYIATPNLSGIPRQVVSSNHQYEIYNRMNEISDDVKLEPKAKVLQLEKLLSLNLKEGTKWLLYKRIFVEAENAGDIDTMVKYGEALCSLDGTDTALLAKMAMALAEKKKDLKKALLYARKAEEKTSEFRLAVRPPNTDEAWFKRGFPEEWQKTNYRKQRSLSLDALGLVLSEMGSFPEAEAKLRQSIEIERSEKALGHLAGVLGKLGRKDEAEKILSEARTEWMESVRKKFLNEQAKDFDLEAVGGQRYKLSDFKGKVVLLNFWATWCGPCAQEMPHLLELYKKNRERGLEILAISVDSKADRYKVAPFAEKYNLTFPVLFGEELAKIYDINAYPTNIFIDRQGNIRYRQSGLSDEAKRVHEFVINELLK